MKGMIERWKYLPLGLSLAAPLVVSGCTDPGATSGWTSGALDDATARTDTDACDPDDYDDLIKALEDLSDWEFDDANMDKAHPKYCEIVQSILDSYELYLELGIDKAVFAKITYRIVNKKHPKGYAAYTDNHADGSSTITYYNP